MSKDDREKEAHVIQQISQLVKHESIEPLVKNILVDLLEDQEETIRIVHELENKVNDIEQSLKDTDAHSRR